MKKKICLLILLLIAIVIAILALFVVNRADSVSKIDGLTISIKEGTLTNTKATIIVTNNSNREYTFGEDYTIEKKVLGQWKKISGGSDWNNLVRYSVAKDDKREMECNWESSYGKLKKGTYRLVKIIDNKRIAIEFKID